MQVSTRHIGDVTVVDVDGRMTRNEGFGCVRQRVVELLDEGHLRFVLNLSQVPYMDTTYVGELVSTYISIRNAGGTLKLAGVLKRISDLLAIAKLDTVFELFDTERAALESFASS